MLATAAIVRESHCSLGFADGDEKSDRGVINSAQIIQFSKNVRKESVRIRCFAHSLL